MSADNEGHAGPGAAVRRVRPARGVLLRCWACGLAVSSFGGTFTNPVVSDGADPWVTCKDGYYYYTQTTGSNIEVRRCTRLAGANGLGAAGVLARFTPPAPFNQNVWAPELHFLQGTAYIYYAADDGSNANHRMFAAVQRGQTTKFDFLGKVYDPAADRWAIDGTVLEGNDGSLYFIWSGWPGTQDGLQNLYIAPMSNPWTLSGPRVLLSTPQLPWESWIQEGPAVLKRNGKVLLVYAANRSWTDAECLGLLVNSDGNYLNPASWTKMPQPVFKTVTGPAGAVFGPGHCSFSQSLDGREDWIFYHAAKYSGAGWDRDVRMQRFAWDASGYPVFGDPIPAGVVLADPSGDEHTPAPFTGLTKPANGARATARAPLPLLTNSWSNELSGNRKNGSPLTNTAGTSFSAEAVDSQPAPQRLHRARSSRSMER